MTVPVPPVTFNYTDFVAQFPEFSALSSPQAQGYFNRASLIVANSICSPVMQTDPSGTTLTTLLYLLTAHVAWLNAPRDSNGNPAAAGSIQSTPLPGMIKSASEGSVSVGLDMGNVTEGSPSQAYFMQTRYGTEYWQMTAAYRTAFYVPRPTRVFTGFYTGRRGVF